MGQSMNAGVAKCIISRHPAEVKAWLATLSGSQAERKIVHGIEVDFAACFQGGPSLSVGWAASYNYEGMREWLVWSLVQQRAAKLPQSTPAEVARANWFDESELQDKGVLASALANSLGFCLARTDWQSTRTLINAGYKSPEEQQSLNRLILQIAGCLSPGQKLVLDRRRLKTIMWETVYHGTVTQ